MTIQDIHIRQADVEDLAAINEVIRASVMSWPLADRVKRLSINVLVYDQMDASHYQFHVAENEQGLVAVAAWDPDHPDSLFHGLYVAPAYQHRGLGKRLIDTVISEVKSLDRDTLVVKAESVSARYFLKQGFEHIESNDPNHYPYLYRKNF